MTRRKQLKETNHTNDSKKIEKEKVTTIPNDKFTPLWKGATFDRFTDVDSFKEFMDNTLDSCSVDDKTFMVNLMSVYTLDNIMDRITKNKIIVPIYLMHFGEDNSQMAPLYNSLKGNDSDLSAIIDIVSSTNPSTYSVENVLDSVLKSLSNTGTYTRPSIYSEENYYECAEKFKECVYKFIDNVKMESYDDESDEECGLVELYNSSGATLTPFEDMMAFLIYAKLSTINLNSSISYLYKETFMSGLTTDRLKSLLGYITCSMICDNCDNDGNTTLTVNILRSDISDKSIIPIAVDTILSLYTISKIHNWLSCYKKDDRVNCYTVGEIIRNGIIAANTIEMIFNTLIDTNNIGQWSHIPSSRKWKHCSNFNGGWLPQDERRELVTTVILQCLSNMSSLYGIRSIITNKTRLSDLILNTFYTQSLNYKSKMILCDIIGIYDVINIVYSNKNPQPSNVRRAVAIQSNVLLDNAIVRTNFNDLEWIYLQTKSKSAVRNAFKIVIETTKQIDIDTLERLSLIDDECILERAIAKYK